MKNDKVVLGLFCTFCVLALGALAMRSQEKAAPTTVQVHMVITDEAVHDDSELPILRPETVKVKQDKNLLKVTQLIPARGDNAALQLFILVDDTLGSGIGTNLNDIRDFINAQPASTAIGIGYMSNTTINIIQNFTADHALAAKALRLPRGTLSAMDSPYLSLISLVKGWPQQNVRREVLMVTDGIDRLRGEKPSRAQLGPSFGPAYHSMPTISVDVDSASTISQRYNVIVYTFYAVGVGRSGRNAWDAQNGLNGIAKLADETGGECFSLGTGNPVSFKPYLERLQRFFDNQYFLVFQANPRNKAGLQRVNISTEAANAEIAAADNVWVPAGK